MPGSRPPGRQFNLRPEKRVTKGDEKKRVSRELTRQVLVVAWFKLYKEKGRCPSYAEVAEAAGVSYPTVFRHFNNMDLDELLNKMKVYTEPVLNSLAMRAIETGGANEVMTFMKIVHQLSDKAEVKLSGDLNINGVREAIGNSEKKDAILRDEPALAGVKR